VKGASMDTAIDVGGLTKYYGKTRGIEDLTFSVAAGQAFGFLGPNGAGKTTTIRCLLGMLKPTAGAASLLGQTVTLDGARLRRRIGYVPGEVRLYENETGRWLLDYVSGLRGSAPSSQTELLEQLEFDPTKRVKHLSKGNKQKLALVIALMHDPELLILDEPTSGLDPLNQQTVFEILGRRRAAGATVFFSSHILPEVEKVCDRVGIVREGRLVAEEDITSLLHKRIRRLEVTFAEPVDAGFLEGLPGLSDIEAFSTHTLRAVVKGEEMDGVLRRVCERRVRDIEIMHADLEEVFLEYYRGTAPEGGEAR